VLEPLKQLAMGGGDPLIELGSVPYGEAREKAGDVGRECPLGLLSDESAEFHHLALDWSGQLDDRSIAADDLTQIGSEVFQGLPEGGARLGFGRFAPEEPGQLLPGVRSRLEHQVGEERETLGPWLRRERTPLRERHGRRPEQCQRDTRHSTTL
jgi:hypothetical protein